MKHIWSILCQDLVIDSKTGLLSLFKCVEGITFVADKSKKPIDSKSSFKVNLNLVSFWSVEDTKKDNVFKLKVELLDPAGKVPMPNFEKEITVKKGKLRFRNFIVIPRLSITKSGKYYFKIWKKESRDNSFKLIAELPVDIKIVYK
jgi:hypothetical protein